MTCVIVQLDKIPSGYSGNHNEMQEKPPAVTQPGLHPMLNNKELKKQANTGEYPWSLHP